MKRLISLGLLLVICITDEAEASRYIGFGDKLFKDGKYDNALIEYKRANFFIPDSLVQYQIGMCYWKLGRLEEAANVFKELGAISELVQVYVELGEYSLARFVCEDRDKNLEGWVYLVEGRWEEAAQSFETEDLKAVSLRGKLLPYKSEKKALLLSIIVPGLGEVYSKNFLGGVLTFSLNVVSGWYAIKSFRVNDYVSGGLITTFLGHRFYIGGIQSAVKSAKSYNDKIKERYIKEAMYKYKCPFRL